MRLNILIFCVFMALTGTIVAHAQDSDQVISYLEIYDVETGTHHVVKEFPYLIEAPNWTPDGKWLVINKEGRLYKIASDGSGDLVEIKSSLCLY